MAEDNKSDPDLDIAVGEDAFRAGWYARADTIGGDSVSQSDAESLLEKAWSEYAPPEKLCGGGAKEECENRWSWGYPDGIPGTPEYEPPARVCNLCKTVHSRCKCDAVTGDLNGGMLQPYDHTKRGFEPK